MYTLALLAALCAGGGESAMPPRVKLDIQHAAIACESQYFEDWVPVSQQSSCWAAQVHCGELYAKMSLDGEPPFGFMLTITAPRTRNDHFSMGRLGSGNVVRLKFDDLNATLTVDRRTEL